jgi:hypothetical protein
MCDVFESCSETVKFCFVRFQFRVEVTIKNMVLWGIGNVWPGRGVTFLRKFLPPFS